MGYLEETVQEMSVPEQIDALSAECYRVAVEHGWWEEVVVGREGDRGPVGLRTVGDLLALMHSELSEALEEYRNGHGVAEIYYSGTEGTKPEGVVVELADVLIRIFDMCGRYEMPLGKALVEKMKYNETRPFRHGGKVL